MAITSLKEKRRIAKQLSQPGRPIYEIAKWYSRDGVGPTPKGVQELVKATRGLAAKTRKKLGGRKIGE